MCKLIMQSFIKALDIKYDELYCCETCMQDGAALVLDAKAMGVKRSTFKLYVPARAAAAPTERIIWLAPNFMSMLLMSLCCLLSLEL